MSGTGDRILRDAGRGREIARNKIAIVARRSHNNSLRIQSRDSLQVRNDFGHVLLRWENGEVIATFQNLGWRRPECIG